MSDETKCVCGVVVPEKAYICTVCGIVQMEKLVKRVEELSDLMEQRLSVHVDDLYGREKKLSDRVRSLEVAQSNGKKTSPSSIVLCGDPGS